MLKISRWEGRRREKKKREMGRKKKDEKKTRKTKRKRRRDEREEWGSVAVASGRREWVWGGEKWGKRRRKGKKNK